MIMTDCAAQLQSSALRVYASKDMDKKVTRIVYGNVVLIHLLHYDNLVVQLPTNGTGKVAVAKMILDCLKVYFGVFLKECHSHVYRAPYNWVHSNKNGVFTPVLRSRFENVMRAAFGTILRVDSISEAILRMSIVIAMFET